MTSYVMKLTAVGAAKIAAATAGGAAVQLTHMAVGDGNGNPVTPTGSETALVREVYRGTLNSLGVMSGDTTRMIAEGLIPSASGNFAVREVGVFDVTGALIAYGNFPETWKPIPTDGSSRDMVIQAVMKVGNSSVVNLVVDASIVAATRQWVISTITRAYIIPGGTTGQILKKNSNASGDTVWGDPSAANITVNALIENQTAVASQQIFTLATCTTVGLAVYVEGARQHNTTALSATQVQLSSPLPAGAKVLFVQNEPNNSLLTASAFVTRIPVTEDTRKSVTLASSTTTTGNLGVIAPKLNVVPIDATRDLLIIYGDASAHAIIYDSASDTFGAPLLLRTATLDAIYSILSAANQVLVVSFSGTGMETIVLGTGASGTTITPGSPVATTLAGAFTGGTNVTGDIIAHASGFAISYLRATTTCGIRMITISGTVPTIGAEVTPTGTISAPVLYSYNSTVLISLSVNSTTLTATPYSASGTTLTPGTTATAAGSFTVTNYSTNFLSTGRASIAYNNAQVYGGIISLSGTVATISTVQLSTIGTSNGVGTWKIGAQVIALATPATTGNSSINVLTDSSGTAVAGTESLKGSPQMFIVGWTATKLYLQNAQGSFYVTISGNNPVVDFVPYVHIGNINTNYTMYRRSDPMLVFPYVLNGATISAVPIYNRVNQNGFVTGTDGTKPRAYASREFCGVDATLTAVARKSAGSAWIAKPTRYTDLFEFTKVTLP